MARGRTARDIDTDMEPDPLLSVAQAAGVLGVHPNTIRAWTEAGRLTAYRINSRGDRRFRRADVLRLLVEDAGGEPHARERLPSEAGLRVVSRIARGLAAAPSAADVARTVVETLRAELAADRVAVYLAGNERLELAAHAGFTAPPPSALPMDGQAAARDGADMDMLLSTRRSLVGLLVVDARTGAAIAGPVMEAIMSSAATALATARLLGRARRDLDRARALSEVGRDLAAELDLTRVLDEIVDRTRSLFGADRAGLWLIGEAEHPVALVTRGLSDRFLERSAALTVHSETIGVRAQREDRPLWARNAHLDPAIGSMRTAYAQEGIRTVCVAPLHGTDGAIGVLGLYHDDDQVWPDEEIALVQAFADQASVAIRNARLYRAAAEQAARMRSIQDLSARLNGLTGVRAIGEAIVAEARTLADYHDIRIYRVDRDRGVCEPIAFTREMLDADATDAEALLRVRIGEGFTGWVAEHGEPLLINDALDDPRGKTIVGTDDVPESMLVVPMMYEGQALGVIVLSQLGFDRFTDDDLQTMRIFAGYAAQAIANATTYEQLVTQSSELARRVDSQRRLLQINERLLRLDQVGVLETIADGLRDVVRYDNLSIYRADQARQVMAPVLTRERHAEEVGRYVIPFGRGLMGWAVENGQPLLANDALSDPRALQIPGTPADAEAVVVVPLVAEGQVLGALNVSRVGGEEVRFSASDFELIQLFAAQASIALSNADAHHAVSKRAETDALTGLGNHGAFQRDLGQHVERAAAATHPDEGRFALVMMDLDRFKAYNDCHGHPAGDALLHAVATAIYGAARSDDRVYRYGGDEFALILPGATAGAAERVARRVRRAVAELTLDDPTPVTITAGIAAMPGDAVDRAGVSAAADAALYHGKRTGEDRIIRADRVPRDAADVERTLDELARAALHDVSADRSPSADDAHGTATDTAGEDEPRDPVHAALIAITRSLDTRSPSGPGHADRVGWLAARIAEALGLSPAERRDVELAARLHVLDDRGTAELSRIDALGPVATLIVGHRRLLADGRRRVRRGARSHGRVGPHIVGVATAYDELVSGVGRRRIGRKEALEAIRANPATWRRDVVEALARAVNGRADEGPRRRRADAVGGARPEEGRGAA